MCTTKLTILKCLHSPTRERHECRGAVLSSTQSWALAAGQFQKVRINLDQTMLEDKPIRDIVLSGEKAHFEGFMEQWIAVHPTGWPSIHGPLYRKASTTWLAANGYNMILDWIKDKSYSADTTMSVSSFGHSLQIRKEMNLADVASLAEEQGFELAVLFNVAEISVTAIPNGQLRILFSEGNINVKDGFWTWVDEFLEELDGYGFKQLKLNAPKWITKRPLDQAMAHYNDIIQAIKNWIPKQRYKSEEAYEAGLAEYLVGLGIHAPEQQGSSLTDILALYGIGIEIKVNPDRSEYDRLVGQIVRQLEEYGLVIALIVRPEKRDLLDEYRSRFCIAQDEMRRNRPEIN